MPSFDYLLWDADNHYYEPRDCFTRYIDPGLRDLAIRPEIVEGVERILIGRRQYVYTDPVLFDRVQMPGSLRTMLREYAAGNANGFYDERVLEDIKPEYQDRAARLRLMDEQGIEGCLMFPGLAVCVEPYMFDDPRQMLANVGAFNRWLDEDWGFAYADRIFSPPLLSLVDADAAVAELEHVLAKGARAIALRPGPQGNRSPADPYFDRFWAIVNEARIPVAYHTGNTGYVQMFSSLWSEDPDPDAHHMSAFQWTNFFGDRPIMETLSALILHNLFGRFPDIRVVVVEHGSLWVGYLLKLMDKMRGMGKTGTWLGGEVREKPSEIFKRHVWVAPYHEEDAVALARLIGPNRVLMGSDYPHPEGLAEPGDFAQCLAGLPSDHVRRVMRDNLRELLAI